ncbi:MAG: SidE phosphodiesterase domain-containing protein [Chlamydiales bacterium]|nr:SidE phosphodiesterase domain-containing protein [Chlamydiales bacterium]
MSSVNYNVIAPAGNVLSYLNLINNHNDYKINHNLNYYINNYGFVSYIDKSYIYTPSSAPSASDDTGLERAALVLKAAGFSKDEQALLNELILKNALHRAAAAARAFVSLKDIGLLYSDHADIYKAVSEVPGLLYEFVGLTKAGLTYQNHIELYRAIVEKRAFFVEGQAKAFIIFEERGFSYQNHVALFDLFLSKGHSDPDIARCFVMLLKLGISNDLCSKLADKLLDAKKFTAVLFLLADNEIVFPECFTEKTLFEHLELMLQVMRKLTAVQFSPSVYANVYRKVVAKLNHEKVDSFSILHLVEMLCCFTAAHEKADPAVFDALIDTHTSPLETLSFGPLNKNEATKRLEQLLEKLSDKNVFDKSRWGYENECYFVIFADGTTYNVSLLIKNANLSHLTLSDELIVKIADLLKNIVIKDAWKEGSQNPIVKLLPPAQRVAVRIYIQDYYKNINSLFRGEKPDTTASKLTNHESEQVAANFLLGCLLHDAVNKFPHLVDEKKPSSYAKDDWVECYAAKLDENILCPIQRKIVAQDEWLKLYAATQQDDPLVKKAVSQKEWVEVYAPHLHTGTLVRKEALTQEDVARRKANPWTFPALTSTSHLPDGTHWISRSKTTFTKIEGTGYVINTSEGEILFSQGTQVMTRESKANEYVSKIVCSPDLEPADMYWSDLALEASWENHLQHAYKEGKNAYTTGSETIHRPNHGLAHTYRMKLNIDYVVNYFAHHAKEERFREFCQFLNNTQVEWLRISAAFCVSGRENETSALEDPVRYKRYRQASTDNFMQFVTKEKPLDNDQAMIERISDVILYMGHPDYESKINMVADQSEREARNFYFRILSMAHKLDLARCYSPSEYTDRMSYFKNHSLESSDQNRDLIETIRYNCALLKAHGNAQSSDITLDGKIIAHHQDYRAPFVEVSRSLKRVREVTDMVPRPEIMRLR